MQMAAGNVYRSLPGPASMRSVAITQEELRQLRELYQSVMSDAAFGLLVREGAILGDTLVASLGSVAAKGYFDAASEELRRRQWVERVEFSEGRIVVDGSIEATPGGSAAPTCHRLRGIIRKLYESRTGQKVYCKELECTSTGAPRCVFSVGEMGGWALGDHR